MLPALITMDLGPLPPPEHFLFILMAIWQSSLPTTLSDRILLLFIVAKFVKLFRLRVRWLPLIECQYFPNALKVEVMNLYFHTLLHQK